MLRIINSLKRPLSFLNQRLHITETGATMVEYALLLALIALVAVGALFALGGGVKSLFNNASTCINSTTSANCPPAS